MPVFFPHERDFVVIQPDYVAADRGSGVGEVLKFESAKMRELGEEGRQWAVSSRQGGKRGRHDKHDKPG